DAPALRIWHVEGASGTWGAHSVDAEWSCVEIAIPYGGLVGKEWPLKPVHELVVGALRLGYFTVFAEHESSGTASPTEVDLADSKDRIRDWAWRNLGEGLGTAVGLEHLRHETVGGDGEYLRAYCSCVWPNLLPAERGTGHIMRVVLGEWLRRLIVEPSADSLLARFWDAFHTTREALGDHVATRSPKYLLGLLVPPGVPETALPKLFEEGAKDIVPLLMLNGALFSYTIDFGRQIFRLLGLDGNHPIRLPSRQGMPRIVPIEWRPSDPGIGLWGSLCVGVAFCRGAFRDAIGPAKPAPPERPIRDLAAALLDYDVLLRAPGPFPAGMLKVFREAGRREIEVRSACSGSGRTHHVQMVSESIRKPTAPFATAGVELLSTAVPSPSQPCAESDVSAAGSLCIMPAASDSPVPPPPLRYFHLLQGYVGISEDDEPASYRGRPLRLARRVDLELACLDAAAGALQDPARVSEWPAGGASDFISVNLTPWLVATGDDLRWVDRAPWHAELLDELSARFAELRRLAAARHCNLVIELKEGALPVRSGKKQDTFWKVLAPQGWRGSNKVGAERAVGLAIDDQFGPGTDTVRMTALIEAARKAGFGMVAVKVDFHAAKALLRPACSPPPAGGSPPACQGLGACRRPCGNGNVPPPLWKSALGTFADLTILAQGDGLVDVIIFEGATGPLRCPHHQKLFAEAAELVRQGHRFRPGRVLIQG
ncbi:MAG: hypothetical protein QME96_01015, partial [Myxococcota bacterium]|nr:hypothetical protein [Myxococcota bacterium]